MNVVYGFCCKGVQLSYCFIERSIEFRKRNLKIRSRKENESSRHLVTEQHGFTKSTFGNRRSLEAVPIVFNSCKKRWVMTSTT